jgi:1,4-alpha-glucan branching enzyme
VEFVVIAEGAKSVAVAGSFNNWDAGQTPLRQEGDVWRGIVQVPRGKYEYRYVVDGEWLTDPNATETAKPIRWRELRIFSLGKNYASAAIWVSGVIQGER